MSGLFCGEFRTPGERREKPVHPLFSMIVSASRRTDIPAFYSDWLLNRLQAGYALTRNPFNPLQVSKVLLEPGKVDCLVFWTKNPAPLLARLDEIDRLGHSYYFHYTLTGCDRTLEERLADLDVRIAAFRRLSERIGPERVLWRFDPIVLTRALDTDHYLRAFAQLAQQLHGFTRQCTISFLSMYAKCKRNLAGIALLPLEDSEKIQFIGSLAAIADRVGIELRACCDPLLTEQCGIAAARCIDGRLAADILGQPVRIKKDGGQRPGCGCAVSVDIGAYNTCPHGCRYCYANVNPLTAARNHASHDPQSPLLTGVLNGRETITERRTVSARAPRGELF